MGASKRTRPPVPSAGTVTSLAARRGRNERLVVYLDGVRAFEVSTELADRESLRVGAQLDASTIGALLSGDAPYRAREHALRLIALRDRSCYEVSSRLKRDGFASEVVQEVVDWLRGLGYVDDAAFAERYAAEKSRSGWGSRRISAELARRGIDRKVAQQVTSAADENGSATDVAKVGVDAALALARRRFASQFATDRETAVRRLGGFLSRRGFDWDTIQMVARTLERELAENEAENGREQPFS